VTYLSVPPRLEKVLSEGIREPRARGTTELGGASLPSFEIDRSWPTVPAQWKLGDVSSLPSNAQDRVWALHRRARW